MAPLRRNRADPANAQSPRGSGGPAPAREAGVADPGTIDALAGVRGAGGDDRAADGRSGAPAIPGGIGGDDPDQTALHTGMLLAWTLLGGRSAQPRCSGAQLEALRPGLKAAGAGPAALATVDAALASLPTEAAARTAFVRTLDTQVRAAVPAQGWAPEDHAGPLLHAGAWLGGLHVVSQAVARAKSAPLPSSSSRSPTTRGSSWTTSRSPSLGPPDRPRPPP